jgi:hypothetical protein
LTVNNILTGCRTFILAEGRVTRWVCEKIATYINL